MGRQRSGAAFVRVRHLHELWFLLGAGSSPGPEEPGAGHGAWHRVHLPRRRAGASAALDLETRQEEEMNTHRLLGAVLVVAVVSLQWGCSQERNVTSIPKLDT